MSNGAVTPPRVAPEDEKPNGLAHGNGVANGHASPPARQVQLPTTTPRKQKREKELKDVKKLKEKVKDNKVRLVGAVDKMALSCGCKKADPGIVYKWKGCSIKPKTVLIVTVAAIMIIMSLSIITVLVGLNVSTILDEVKNTNKFLAEHTGRLAVHINDASQTSVLEYLNTAVQFSAASVIQVYDQMFSLQDKLLVNTAERVGNTISLEADRIREHELSMMREMSSVFRSTYDSMGTRLGALQMLDALVARTPGMVMAVLSIGTSDYGLVLRQPPQYNSCPTCKVSDLPCVQMATATDSGSQPGIDGAPWLYSRFVVHHNVNALVCLMRPVATLNDKVKAAAVDLIGRINALQSSVLNPTDFGVGEVVQNRWNVLKTKSGTLNPVFKDATVEAGARSFLDPNYLASLSTFTTSTTANLGVFLTRTSQDTNEQFKVAYGASKFLTDAVQLRVIGGNSSRVWQVGREHTEGTIDTRESPHYLFATLGLQGSTKGRNVNGQEVLAGFSSMTPPEWCLVLEVPINYLRRTSAQQFQEVIEAHNTRMDRSRHVTVMRKDRSGRYVYVVEPPNCNGDCSAHEAAVKAFRVKRPGSMVAKDPMGSTVQCNFVYVAEFDYAVVVQVDMQDAEKIILLRVMFSIVVAVVLTVLSQAAIQLLTMYVLDRIEKEYNTYKNQIEAEKLQFSELVKDVMPPYISARLMAGEQLIADNHPLLTFFFSDILGFQERTKNMNTAEMVRVLGYTFFMEDMVASYYGIHKIKTIGDAYFAVAGLEDHPTLNTTSKVEGAEEEKKEKVPELHQVYRMVSFAAITEQLLSSNFIHYPERTDCFATLAERDDLPPLRMVSMKMGIHSGPAIAGVVDVGRAPHFDCFGPSVNLSSRMETTASVGKLQISAPTMDLLAKQDKRGVFVFEQPKKTLIKGYGTMSTFTLKSTTIQVPKQLLDEVRIDRAVKRVNFNREKDEEERASRSDVSVMSMSQHSGMSFRSSRAGSEGSAQARDAHAAQQYGNSPPQVHQQPMQVNQPLPSAPPPLPQFAPAPPRSPTPQSVSPPATFGAPPPPPPPPPMF